MLKLTILIIDDEPLFLRSTAQLLSSKYRCISANSGEAGLQRADESKPDMVICDVQMVGGTSGFEVCDQLKSKDSSLPVILLTNFNDQECRMQGLKSGANDYLSKRVENEELLQRVENTMVLAGKLSPSSNESGDGKTLSANEQGEQFDDAKFLERLAQVLRAILKERQNHNDTSLDLIEVSRRIHMSKRTLQRRLVKANGQRFTEFRQDLQMNAALELLLRDFTLSEIAHILDISSQSYFTRLFKRYYGCSPSEYKTSKPKNS